MKVLENDNVKYWIEDGILHNELKKPIVMTLDIVKEFITMRHEISDGEKQYWCSELRGVKSMSKEARDYADIHGQDYLYCSALIVNSHVTMFLFNSFIKLKKMRVPVRVFKDKSEAVKWLKEMKSKNEQLTK